MKQDYNRSYNIHQDEIKAGRYFCNIYGELIRFKEFRTKLIKIYSKECYMPVYIFRKINNEEIHLRFPQIKPYLTRMEHLKYIGFKRVPGKNNNLLHNKLEIVSESLKKRMEVDFYNNLVLSLKIESTTSKDNYIIFDRLHAYHLNRFQEVYKEYFKEEIELNFIE